MFDLYGWNDDIVTTLIRFVCSPSPVVPSGLFNPIPANRSAQQKSRRDGGIQAGATPLYSAAQQQAPKERQNSPSPLRGFICWWPTVYRGVAPACIPPSLRDFLPILAIAIVPNCFYLFFLFLLVFLSPLAEHNWPNLRRNYVGFQPHSTDFSQTVCLKSWYKYQIKVNSQKLFGQKCVICGKKS